MPFSGPAMLYRLSPLFAVEFAVVKAKPTDPAPAACISGAKSFCLRVVAQ